MLSSPLPEKPRIERVTVGLDSYERMEIVSIMKSSILAIAMVALLVLGGQASGEICAVDNVPAATLLIPYFSVDTTCGATDATTFFTIANAAEASVVAHVTVWTDSSDITSTTGTRYTSSTIGR